LRTAAENPRVCLGSGGAEPGGAGYLSALAVSRTKNWNDFRKSVASYKVPSENLVYADRSGNIGWIASGLAPIRKNWSGLFPVPGDKGEYDGPATFPSTSTRGHNHQPLHHAINILPKAPHQLSYEWAALPLLPRQMFGAPSTPSLISSVCARSLSVPPGASNRSSGTPPPPTPMKDVYQRMLKWDAA
jgi:penicillin amidase